MSVEQIDNLAQVRVQDTGAGIAPDQLPYVFDRFYRTDQARSRYRGGAGLGLAIVRAIAESHSGTVEVTSHIQQGSTFTLSLPLEC